MAILTDIFFSYASKDRERVELAHRTLTQRGFHVFWDVDVPPGVEWDRRIKAKLDHSPCVIVFWTPNSIASVNVQHEVAIAREQGTLLQAILEPVATRDLPMGILTDQSVNLMHWRGDTNDQEWVKLLAAIENKATPKWLLYKVAEVEVALKAECERVAEADARVHALEEAHTREVVAQGDLRRERDKFKSGLDHLKAEFDLLTTENCRLAASNESAKLEFHNWQENFNSYQKKLRQLTRTILSIRQRKV